MDVATAQQAAEDLSRLEAALYAFQLIGEHPVLGSGFGTFPARNYDKNGVYVVTHNTILQALSGTGTLGTVFLGVLLWALAHALRRPGQILYLPVAGCFAVNSLFGDYLQSIDVLAILAVTYLLCWQAAHPVRPAQHAN